MLPLWKARRSRTVPLESVDPDGELRSLLAALATETGLRARPRVVLDPAAASTGAVVFGSTRRPVLLLPGGLLATRRHRPARFRAVLLHELAHVANRDVGLYYATVAAWRVFLVLVLLPYLLLQGHQLYDTVAAGQTPSLDRDLLLAVFIVALVHLSRADTLRSREFHADLTALRWGADPHAWSGDVPPDPASSLGRVRARFLALWHTHPGAGLRRDALTDPAPLFRVSALFVFLTGAAATLVMTHLLNYQAPYWVASTGTYLAAALLPAAMAAGVTGIALWRAVVYAVLTGAKVPSGGWPGMWLGAGVSVGTVLTGTGMGWSWLPERPLFLLLPVAAGAALGWWTAQCAHLYARTWRGRTLRPALLLGLVALFVALASWFVWWQLMGAGYLGGLTVRAEGVAQWLLGRFPTTAPAQELVALPGLATVIPLLDGFGGTPLVALAGAGLWVVPLIAWAVGRGSRTPRWASTAAPLPDAPVPALRRILLPGLLGGALACVALVAVQAYLHAGRPAPDARGGLYALRYAGWTLLALTVPAALAATAAGVRARAAAGRFRLVGALVAAQTATLVGFAGVTALVSVDGCAAALSVLQDDCAVRAPWTVWLFPYVILLNITSVLGTLAAVAAAVAVTAASRIRPLASAASRAAGPIPAEPRAAEPRGPAAGGGGGADTARHRLTAALMCTVAVGTAMTVGAVHLRVLSVVPEPSATAAHTTQLAGVPERPVSDETRVRQVHAWYHLSGDDLMDLVAAYSGRLHTALREARSTDSWVSLDARFRPVCDLWRRAGTFGVVWFRVPDRSAQADWYTFTTRAAQGSRQCAQALDARNHQAFLGALRELVAADRCAAKTNARIDTVLREGGRRGTRIPPAKEVSCDRVSRQ
ncbi:M48 family metalloprotease [Streptomyces sp. NPDC052309]|uniref:M48 family metalloprotease n=1 Tax=Streptomyces sp. NPDC052309 TaxID=3155421 RepID=UPI0034141C26